MRPLPPLRASCSGCGAAFDDVTYQEAPGRDYRFERDRAYTERNCVVAALARLIVAAGGRAWLAEHPPDPNWDPEWRTIVFIEGPTGQMSWHLHDSDVRLFDGFPRGANAWDGHSTPEKYERVARLGRPQCMAYSIFSPTEGWRCQLEAGHDGGHVWPNPAETVT